MIDNEEESELLVNIRKKKELEALQNGRGDNNGRTLISNLPRELQSTYRITPPDDRGVEQGISPVQGDAGIDGGNNSRPGQQQSESNQSGGGVGEITRRDEGKPSGLNPLPSMREALERPRPETEDERKRRLNRERQARHNQKKKDDTSGDSPLSSSSHTVAQGGAASSLLSPPPPAAPPPWKRIFGGGSKMSRPLTEAEAEELKEPLTEAVIGITDFLDAFIKATTIGHEDVEIWSTMDDSQIEKIVNDRLKRGRRSSLGAQVVRRTIEYYEELAIYAIVLPKTVQTVQLYRERGIGIH